MPKILFILEKWCGLHSSFGLSNSQHNLLGSCRCSGLATHDAIYYDELQSEGRSVDAAILALERPDCVVLSLGDWPRHHSDPTKRTIASLGVPICCIWWDVLFTANVMAEWDDITSLHIVMDNLELSKVALRAKAIWLPTPQDETLYYHDQKRADVAVLGSKHPVRRRCAEVLGARCDLNVNVGGGQREAPLSAQDYAMGIRTAKINVDTHEHPWGPQLKGRTQEALASRSLLFELTGGVLDRFYTSGVEYVEFTEHNLLSLVYHYLECDRWQVIADRGFLAYHARYSARHFWAIILQHLL